MSLYITIDGGTTNTRVNLVEDRKIINTLKLNVGARANMDDNTLLKTQIKCAITQILSSNSLTEKDISRILASGMITSEFGLCSLEHILTPAGIDELHDTMHEMVIDEISSIPFVFIRGVKAVSDNFECTDIMRGEETEFIGILENICENCICILPGSHSKIISTDDKKRICNFATMLTGEMTAALSQNTILKDAVDLSVEEINAEYLIKGYDYCKGEGINKALFKTRILKNMFGHKTVDTYSFFMGVILCGEIEQILNSQAEKVIIGGKAQIKNAMAEILKRRTNKEIICLDENTVNNSTSIGAVRIYEKRITGEH